MDRLADRLPGLLQLLPIADLARDAGVGAAADAQAHPGVRPDIPNPGRNGCGSLDRKRRWAQLDDKSLVPPPDRADAFTPLNSALSPSGGKHAVSGWCPDREERKHHRAENASIPLRAE